MTLPDNLYRMQFALHSVSGLAADDAVMTTHYTKGNTGGPALSDTEAQNIANAWATFIASAKLGHQNTGHWTAKFYRMSDTEPRVPYMTKTDSSPVGLDSVDGQNARELAIAVSWSATQISGVKPSRQRARNFIGPLGPTAGPTTDGRPNPTVVAAMATAAHTFLTTIDGLSGTDFIHLVVFSRGKGSRKPDGTYRPDWTPFTSRVTHGWVDNEWDVQRRRGLKPTSRSTFTN